MATKVQSVFLGCVAPRATTDPEDKSAKKGTRALLEQTDQKEIKD